MKYQVIDEASGERIAQGIVERIGEAQGGRIVHTLRGVERERELHIPNHAAAFAAITESFMEGGQPLESLSIAAIGHRVVHGGSDFIAPVRVTPEIAARILELSELAPLHNPGHHAAIVAASQIFPNIPQVAVFDTAFHQTMPEAAYTYAIDAAVAAENGVRRYGFHGISHSIVSRRTAEFLEQPLESLKQIVLHLGNGASMCAIDGGKSIDTSMGMTPLAGLVMGTRTGDIDPGVLLHLQRRGMGIDELDEVLNKRSGFLGFVGSNDYRDVRAAAEGGDHAAQLAIDVYVHRARHFLGAYLAQLEGADAVVFTAGLGENAADLRALVCAGFEWAGIRLDPALNESSERGARVISSADSRVTVLVVPTDEEAEIARQSLALVRGDAGEGTGAGAGDRAADRAGAQGKVRAESHA